MIIKKYRVYCFVCSCVSSISTSTKVWVDFRDW